MTLGILTDIHHNSQDAFPKICSEALPLMKSAMERFSLEEVDLVVDLGDRIDDRGKGLDLKLAHDVAGAFRRYRSPCEHLMGNHDSYFMTPSDWENVLGRPVQSRSWVIDGNRLVFFAADVDNGRGARDYSLRDAELEWLERELARDDRDTILFTHVPLMAGIMTGHYYFENKPGRAAFLNSIQARAIIERTGSVQLVVSGHVHWNSWGCCNGVHYVTLQSLTESFTTGGKACGAHSVLHIGSNEIRIRVLGADPIEFVLPRRLSGSRWVEP